MTDTLKKQALSGVVWTTIQTFGSQILAFFVSVILARLLVPEEFGLIAMITLFIGIGSILINGGLGQSLIRTENADDLDFSTVFYFNLAGSFLIYLIMFFVAPWVAQFYKQPMLTPLIRVFCLTFIIDALASTQQIRLTKYLQFKLLTKITLPSLVISSSVGIIMAYNGFGVWSLVFNSLGQSFVSAVFLWIFSGWKPKWAFCKVKFKRHFSFGVKLLLSGLLDIVFVNAYTIIIGKFYSVKQVAYYSRADSLQMLPVGNIGAIVSKIAFPLFSNIQGDLERLKRVFKKIMQTIIFLIVPVLMIMAALGEPLIRFVFTEKWLPILPFFQILCFNGILYPIHGYNLQVLNVMGRSDLFLKLEIFKKVVTLIGLYISYQFGIFGLLYGSVILSIIGFFINSYYSGKFIKYRALDQIKDLLPFILIGIVVRIIVSQLYKITPIHSDLVNLIVLSAVGTAIYLGANYLFNRPFLNMLVEDFNLKRFLKRKAV